MILVDRREGDSEHNEYEALIARAGGAVSTATLLAGDFAIPGLGPSGVAMMYGVERKALSDLLGTIRDGRLVASQIPKLRNAYDFTMLLVEGSFRRSQFGAIEIPWGREWKTPQWARFISYDGLMDWLNSKRFKLGLRVERTASKHETVKLLMEIERWWSAGWDSHTSDMALDRSYPLRDRDSKSEWSEMPLRPITLPMRVAKELPGLGNQRAIAAGDAFNSVQKIASATLEEWEAVPGIGPKTAAEVYHAVRKEW